MTTDICYFDEDIKAAVGIFKGFITSDEFKNIANSLHKIRIDNNSNKQLNNIEDMNILTKDIRIWLKDEWFPRAVETGLNYFAFVVPKDLFGIRSMKEANKEAQNFPTMDIQYFEDEASAREWLKYMENE